VNAYGDVQPCTFAQVSFGNVKETSLRKIRERGLQNKIFNVYDKHCPPAENCAFITAYTETVNHYQECPVQEHHVFDVEGCLKQQKEQRHANV
jgi:MoaA/NifB/PqqE/SkfB family radical SAM enzyme